MENTTISKTYFLTPEESEARAKTYSYLQDMIDLKNLPMPHFSGPDGQRSWLTLIDDSERILNGYTFSREQQGKEEWQSNMMDNISRAKMRAICAGIGLKVPEMSFECVNDDGVYDKTRAELIKTITRQSFHDGNPTMHAFLETWHMLSHGVVFEYEGYKTGGAMRKRVISFDSLTGEVETKKEYVKMDGKPFTVLLNPQEFYWWDFYIRDIQEQPRVAWVQHYTKSEIELEFSKFKNYKYIKDRAQALQFTQLQDTLYFDKWKDRVKEENDYEVLRMYSKEDDLYEVWINGIPLIRSPLIWGDKEKMYPFAKEVSEHYANTNFFVGMPFGQIMEAYQDQKNTVINTLADKLYRSMDKPYLVGLQNKDLFDVEDKFVNSNNRYYVPDINQVKPLPADGINSGELAFLQILDRGIETMSVDRSQQGQASGGAKTAREVMVADQRAQEMKSILYLSLENLWYQKTRLRVQIVLSHYLQDKALHSTRRGQIISVKDYAFGDGARGILDIHIAKSKAKLLSPTELQAREAAMEQQGIPYKLISMTHDYLDGWQADFKIIPSSFHNQDQATKTEELMTEIQHVSTLFPEFFVANKDHYLKEILELHGEHPSEFNPPAMPAPPTQPGQPAPAPAPAAPPTGVDNVLGI